MVRLIGGPWSSQIHRQKVEQGLPGIRGRGRVGWGAVVYGHGGPGWEKNSGDGHTTV